MPQEGLPSVSLPATDGRGIDLSQTAGRSLLIVYPWTGRPGQPNPPRWDDIPGAHGSTPQLQGFRDRTAEFAALGIGLYGLSRQTTAYQRELVDRLGLPFPILSDERDRLWPALSVGSFETGGMVYLRREAILIGSGRIERRFTPSGDPADHASEVLAALAG